MMGTPTTFRTISELADWCGRAPAGTHLDACVLADTLTALEAHRPVHPPTESPEPPAPETWRERLWRVPAETRLGVAEVAEALGRPKSFIYARTGPKAEDMIPHRKLDGALMFAAGELRAWIRAREEVVCAGAMDSTLAERKGALHAT